ncbi:acetyl-CoA carboxylase biotin carboxyl carrier protein [Pueribacillus sp. YX66]|uniref:acetyl-CoA carboxylase biotin carboxyl carrier protein n=1 Tax=Pueribacillus sp. YX66 TaxID=3229242 RepID=UPI00358D7F5B
MFKIQEIREIIRLIDQSSINEFTYENEGTTITLKKNNGVVAPESIQQVAENESVQSQSLQSVVKTVETQEKKENIETVKTEDRLQETNLLKIESPMVGTFYAAPSPEEPPYVQIGDKVKEDSIVCIVEAMKLFNEIEAEMKGEIVEILVENGQLVEYGQPLFLVKPE